MRSAVVLKHAGRERNLDDDLEEQDEEDRNGAAGGGAAAGRGYAAGGGATAGGGLLSTQSHSCPCTIHSLASMAECWVYGHATWLNERVSA